MSLAHAYRFVLLIALLAAGFASAEAGGRPDNKSVYKSDGAIIVAQSPLPNWGAGLLGEKAVSEANGGADGQAGANTDEAGDQTKNSHEPAAPATSQPASQTQPAAPQAATPPAPPSPQVEALVQPVKRIGAILDDLEKTVERVKDRDDDLSKVRGDIDKIPAEAKKAIETIRPRLSDLQAQLDKLGPAPKQDAPAEAAQVAAERARLNSAVTELDGAIKSLQLAQEKARQLVQYVQELRQTIFTRYLLRRTKDSPLKPSLWAKVAEEMPNAGREIANIARGWWETAAERKLELIGLVLATLLVYFGFRHLRRRVVRQKLVAADELPSFFQRASAAGWFAPAVAIPAASAAIVLYVGLDSNGLLYLQSGQFAESVLIAFLIFIGAAALSRAVLQPGRSNWRLLDVSDATAHRLNHIVRGIVAAYAIDLVLRDLIRMLYLPFQVNVAQAFVFSLIFAALLFALARTRFEPRTATSGEPVSRWRPLWLKLPIVGFATTIAGASLLGYVALGRYISSQVVLTGSAVVAIVLLHLAIRAIAGDSSVQGGSVSAKIFNGRLTLDEHQRRQMDVFLYIALNVVLAFFAVPFMLFVWGFSTPEIAGLVSSALFGFDIGGIHISPARILLAIVLFVALIFVTRLVQRWLGATLLQPSRIDPGLSNSIHTGVGYAGYAIAALAALSYGGLDITNLAIVAGALSVGIGFGLQSIVNNFVSGLILLVERPIKVGDWISVGGFEGYVRSISVRSTEIETFDRSSVIVPNSELISGTVKNRTHRNALGRVDVAIGVAYKEDPAVVRALLETVVVDSPMILKFPAPIVSFDNFGASSLDFTVRAYVGDVNKSLATATDLRIRIFKALQENGIEIPFPQTDVHLRDLDLVKAIVARAAAERARRETEAGLGTGDAADATAASDTVTEMDMKRRGSA